MRFIEPLAVFAGLLVVAVPLSAQAGDCSDIGSWEYRCYDEESDSYFLKLDPQQVGEALGVHVVAAVGTMGPDGAKVAAAVAVEEKHQWLTSLVEVSKAPEETTADDLIGGMDASMSSTASSMACGLDGGSSQDCGFGGEPEGGVPDPDQTRHANKFNDVVHQVNVLLHPTQDCHPQIVEVCREEAFSYQLAGEEEVNCTVDQCDFYQATVCNGQTVGLMSYYGPGRDRNLNCQ